MQRVWRVDATLQTDAGQTKHVGSDCWIRGLGENTDEFLCCVNYIVHANVVRYCMRCNVSRRWASIIMRSVSSVFDQADRGVFGGATSACHWTLSEQRGLATEGTRICAQVVTSLFLQRRSDTFGNLNKEGLLRRRVYQTSGFFLRVSAPDIFEQRMCFVCHCVTGRQVPWYMNYNEWPPNTKAEAINGLCNMDRTHCLDCDGFIRWTKALPFSL